MSCNFLQHECHFIGNFHFGRQCCTCHVFDFSLAAACVCGTRLTTRNFWIKSGNISFQHVLEWPLEKLVINEHFDKYLSAGYWPLGRNWCVNWKLTKWFKVDWHFWNIPIIYDICLVFFSHNDIGMFLYRWIYRYLMLLCRSTEIFIWKYLNLRFWDFFFESKNRQSL